MMVRHRLGGVRFPKGSGLAASANGLGAALLRVRKVEESGHAFEKTQWVIV